MGYSHHLQLSVGIESYAFEQIGYQVLVWIIAQLLTDEREVKMGLEWSVEVHDHATHASTVPDSISCPWLVIAAA